ncbi:MAG: DUF2334 domain-containing protein [Gemmatimonadota bacterium]|nr:DUF2334 domain-containing protein [Gemmatimonadota bacterium]
MALRYDDFSNGSPDRLDEFVVGTVRDLGLAMTVAAIPWGNGPEASRAGLEREPGPLSDGKARLLGLGEPSGERSGRGRIELAQHGFDHEPAGREGTGRPAEFAGLSPSEQTERIGRGLRILERVGGRRPRTFVPPWNRYDAGTISGLAAHGFEVLSAGRDAPAGSRPGPAAAGIAFVPATLGCHELRAAVEEALEARATRLLIPLLHPYDFLEMRTPWSRLDRHAWAEELAALSEERHLRWVTMHEVARSGEDVGYDRLRAFAAYGGSPTRRLVPPAIVGSLERPIRYHPTRDEARSLGRTRAWLAAGFHGTVGAAALLAGQGLRRMMPADLTVLLGAIFAIGAVALTWWAIRGEGPYFRGVLVTVIAFSLAAGVWIR